MSPYSFLVKKRARVLRGKGYSFRELSERFGISKSTASLWTRKVRLGAEARRRLSQVSQRGTKRGRETIRENVRQRNKQIKLRVTSELNSIYPLGQAHKKLLLAMLFWCEGSKRLSDLRFTNSDPELINVFLGLMRESFDLDEKKFRCMLHLHSYHSDDLQLDFWSKLTHIPRSQFYRVHQKTRGGKRIHEQYQGCLSIYYHDASLARELYYFYQEFIGV